MGVLTVLRKLCVFLFEFSFVILTVAIVVIAATMALFIGYVLPRQILDPEMINYTHMPLLSNGVSAYMKKLDRLRTKCDIKDYPFLVSLSRQIYVDDPESMEFMCVGNIISRYLVLTGIDCIRPLEIENFFLQAQVRSNSSYFSKGGQLHKVKSFRKCPDGKRGVQFFPLYILEVTPEFSKHVNIPTLARVFRKPPDYFECVGFGGNMNSKHDLLAGSKFHLVQFQTKPLPGLKEISKDTFDHEAVLLGTQKEMYLLHGRMYYSPRTWFVRNYKTDGRPLLARRNGRVYIFGIRMVVMNPWAHPLTVDYHFQLFESRFLSWIANYYRGTQLYNEYNWTQEAKEDNEFIRFSWISSHEAKYSLSRYMLVDVPE